MEAELRAFLAGVAPRSTGASPAAVPGRVVQRGHWVAGLGLLTLGALVWIFVPKKLSRGPLELQVEMYRQSDTGEIPLTRGDTVAVGDRLFLEVRADEDSYCYVFNEDNAGHLYTLFPLTDFETMNPLRGGVTHRLPGRRSSQGGEETGLSHWQVTSPGKGLELFLVVAGREPVAVAESLRREIPEANSETPIDKTFADLRDCE